MARTACLRSRLGIARVLAATYRAQAAMRVALTTTAVVVNPNRFKLIASTTESVLRKPIDENPAIWLLSARDLER